MNQPRQELIRYRRQKARETLRDAEILFDGKRLFSAVNRIYYALFYEIIALLLTQELFSAKHSGVRALLNEHFIKTGKVTVEAGKFYAHMFEFRQKGDYGDFVEFNEEKVRTWLKEAGRFIEELEKVIEQEISSTS